MEMCAADLTFAPLNDLVYTQKDGGCPECGVLNADMISWKVVQKRLS